MGGAMTEQREPGGASVILTDMHVRHDPLARLPGYRQTSGDRSSTRRRSNHPLLFRDRFELLQPPYERYPYFAGVSLKVK
jgi:hypothetical protein